MSAQARLVLRFKSRPSVRIRRQLGRSGFAWSSGRRAWTAISSTDRRSLASWMVQEYGAQLTTQPVRRAG